MESVSVDFPESWRWVIELTRDYLEVITDRPLEILRSGQFNGKYLWSHRNFNEVSLHPIGEFSGAPDGIQAHNRSLIQGYRLWRKQLCPHQHRLERDSTGTIFEPLEARVIGLSAGSVDRCLRRADIWVGAGRHREAVSLVAERDPSNLRTISYRMLNDVDVSVYSLDNRYSDGTFGCQSVWMARAFQNQSYIVSATRSVLSFIHYDSLKAPVSSLAFPLYRATWSFPGSASTVESKSESMWTVLYPDQAYE